MDYLLLLISSALAVLGVLSKRTEGKLSRTNITILSLVLASLLFGLLQTYQKRVASKAATGTRQAEVATLTAELKQAQAETRSARAQLSQQSKINLFAVLSGAPPVRKIFFHILDTSKTYPLPNPLDPTTTLLGHDLELRQLFVEAAVSVRMTLYGGGFDVILRPNGPALSGKPVERNTDGKKWSLVVNGGRIDASLESTGTNFGNAAIVLRDLESACLADITLRFRSKPSTTAVERLKKHLTAVLGQAGGTVELLESSTFAVQVEGRLADLQVNGTEVRAQWCVSSEPELYLMAM